MEEKNAGLIDVDMDFETTSEIPIPSRLVDQVIGQDGPVEIIKKAAIQRRNVLLIGDPGTGKSAKRRIRRHFMFAQSK
jgi:Lon-like ATP-dependent protease